MESVGSVSRLRLGYGRTLNFLPPVLPAESIGSPILSGFRLTQPYEKESSRITLKSVTFEVVDTAPNSSCHEIKVTITIEIGEFWCHKHGQILCARERALDFYKVRC